MAAIVPAGTNASVIAVELSHLTELLGDAAYTSEAKDLALRRHLDAWSARVGGLWPFKGMAFSIRLHWLPDEGRTRLYLLARVDDVRVGREALDRLASAVNTATVQVDPLEVCAPEWVRGVLKRSLEGEPLIAELRQREMIYPLQVGLLEFSDAFAILPFRRPVGNWAGVCEALAQTKHRIVVSMHVEPTALLPAEVDAIDQAIGHATNLTDFDYPGLMGPIRFKNPHAPVLAEIYRGLRQRLQRPFLALMQVAGESPADVDTIAEAFGRAVVEVGDEPNMTAEREAVVPDYDVWRPEHQREAHAASRTLTTLDLTPWGSSKASPGKERLPFLSDAAGASALFRLPVPTEAGLSGIPVRRLKQGFETGRIVRELPEGHIEIGRQPNGSRATVAIGPRHMLVCGKPNSGKSNTTLSLLVQLWRDHGIPFWVIEPPKTEYRGLLAQPGFENALVFTVGEESCTPFRLNPFELLPKVSVEEHIRHLGDSFAVGLPSMGDGHELLVMLMDKAIRDVYSSAGWRLKDFAGTHPYPTMQDLVAAARKAVDGYSGETRKNLEAAVTNRIGSLLRGSAGRMFNIQQGVPMKILMDRPVIFELMYLGADKGLVLMLLLNTLIEWARKRSPPPGKLVHVTVVEETGVVMKRHDSSKGSSSVSDIFGQMLDQLRGSGEAIIVADQSPTRLVKSAIDNTDVKIVHRLAGGDEVEAVGTAMSATKEQQAVLPNLPVGQAMVHHSDLQGPIFVQARNYKQETSFAEQMSPEELQARMSSFYKANPGLNLPFHGCNLCRSQCQFRHAIEPVASPAGVRKSFKELQRAVVSGKEGARETRLRYLRKVAGKVSDHRDAAWCLASHLWPEDYMPGSGMRASFDRQWDAEIKGTETGT